MALFNLSGGLHFPAINHLFILTSSHSACRQQGHNISSVQWTWTPMNSSPTGEVMLPVCMLWRLTGGSSNRSLTKWRGKGMCLCVCGGGGVEGRPHAIIRSVNYRQVSCSSLSTPLGKVHCKRHHHFSLIALRLQCQNTPAPIRNLPCGHRKFGNESNNSSLPQLHVLTRICLSQVRHSNMMFGSFQTALNLRHQLHSFIVKNL